MFEKDASLGKLESAYGVAPAYLQRAMIVAVLSFAFFLATMFAFYVRQNIGYFLLSTAFLLVYVLTMFGWVMLRRNVLEICEKGFSYRKFRARWDEIEAVEDAKQGATRGWKIRRSDGAEIFLTDAVGDVQSAIRRIQAETAGRRGKV